MTDEDELTEERNKLLRLLVKMELDEKLESKSEKEKAKYLKQSGLSNQEIANLLNKKKSTVSAQISRG